jgi:8-oxo-dGTP pyrophosphatase MutT (NUDIX family)
LGAAPKNYVLGLKRGDWLTELITEQRAGGVVFRIGTFQIEYLLVTSNSNPDRWIIPAGHIETGETPEEAAFREVCEEAGVRGKVIADLGSYHYHWYRHNQKILLNTHLYLMEYQTTFKPNPEGRQVRFYPYETLLTLNLWDESKNLIKKAHQLCREISKEAEGK